MTTFGDGDYITGTGQVLYGVHSPLLCAERTCVIHAPSLHRLANFPTNWREDRQIMERICGHGVGHPDPDDAAYRASQGDHDTQHGCDGCCSNALRENSPGTGGRTR